LKETLDLSLAIVTYNNSSIIEKTIKSILDNIPIEIKYKLYIIDNNSTDKTLELVKKMKGNIEVLDLQINKGFGYGHNSVIDLLSSNYHAVVNPDIIIENQDQLKKMIEYMDNNKSVGMISPLIVNTDLSIQYLCKTNPTVFDMLIRRISPKLFPKRQDKYVLKETGYNQVINIDYASGCFMMFRTSIFKEIKGFDDRFFMYLEDADITRRVNQVSNAIFYPKARVIHAWERGNHKSFKLALITVESMIVYFKKWGLKLY
jgi:GT2 family glycosyltransferase